MSKKIKLWLITATSFIVAGAIMFVVGMTLNGWDFTKLSTVKYETNAYNIEDGFKSISIETYTSDIKFVLSNDGICRVVCTERENVNHSVVVRNGKLEIKAVDTREWYEYIELGFGSEKITVYLPDAEYASLLIKASTSDITIPKDFKFENIDISVSTGDVETQASASSGMKINTSTGNVSVKDVTSGKINISVSMGNVHLSSVKSDSDIKIKVSTGDSKLKNIECGSVISSGSTGDIELKNVVATKLFSLERSTGNIIFDKCDANEIFAETSTGDVKGSLISDKVFITKTDTGDIDVPKSIVGGRCEITTDTGDIDITIKN